MAQSDFRMPKTGDSWRHYKMGLYTVVGIAYDDEGHPQVVYTDFTWGLPGYPPLYTQPLGRFLETIKIDVPFPPGTKAKVQRFRYEGSDFGNCKFIRPERSFSPDKLDAKFYGTIYKAKDGSAVPEDEWVCFLAKDHAFAHVISDYYLECKKLCADQEQLDAIERMMVRITHWRNRNQDRCKVPDAKDELLLDSPVEPPTTGC